MEITKALRDSFNAKWVLDEPTGCWLWTASTAGKGYGQIRVPGTRRNLYAHRLSWMIYRGKVPDAMNLCHTCDTPLCVNPVHLFLGTTADNLADMARKGRSSATARLKENDVAEIRRIYATGALSQARLAKAFGVSQIQISRIVTGKQWAHAQKE